MMNFFVEKVKNDTVRAAKYLESDIGKHSEGYRVQIDSLQDSVRLIHIADIANKSQYDLKQVLADAQSILLKLKCGLVEAQAAEKLAAPTLPQNSTVQHNLIDISKFSGNGPLNYRSFINLFMNRISCNSSLTEIEKLILLKKHLTGEAYDVINKIPNTKNNFSLSLQLLEEMYNNDEKKCINALFDCIKTLPDVLTNEIVEIRKTYWELEAILRSFEEYGELENENTLLQWYYLQKFMNVSSLDVDKLFKCKLNEIRERVRHLIEEKEPADISELICFKKSSSSNDESCFVPNNQKQSGSESDSAEPSEVHDQLPSALTTCTIVQSPESGRKTSVRLVISSGRPSLVSESVVKRLGVESNNEKKTSGSKATGKMNTSTIDLQIHVPNRPPVRLTARIVKDICIPTVFTPTPTVAEFKKDHPHLVDMDFPDTGCGLPLELLIGGDTELVSISFNSKHGLNNEECPRVNRSLGWSLVSTMFGWIIVSENKNNPVLCCSLSEEI